ncbi:Clint1 protein [Capsaspora owczarzaki ATCC 30864]|uniref:Clint1 protein n=2 Tax=Capsaspora owczarzaki (strain ATCC 30864) TaxID=595528 RepID=A0A0D2WQQ5_CAPO3|nr:Clint1 protein [Capsaspora owczarzaki ATCC 30864]
MNYSEVETKVREATSAEPWGPSSTLMLEIARHTFVYDDFADVMAMLWKRMFKEKLWRHTYKSLLLLDYLLHNGSEKVIEDARDHVFDIRRLESFQATDEKGKDQGLNVRHKAKDLIGLIQDDERLREERRKAKVNRDKYTGTGHVTSGDRYGGFSSSERYDDYDAPRANLGSDSSGRKAVPRRGRQALPPAAAARGTTTATAILPPFGSSSHSAIPHRSHDDDDFGNFASGVHGSSASATAAQQPVHDHRRRLSGDASAAAHLHGGASHHQQHSSKAHHQEQNLFDVAAPAPAQQQGLADVFGGPAPRAAQTATASGYQQPSFADFNPRGASAAPPAASNNAFDDFAGFQAPASSANRNFASFPPAAAPPASSQQQQNAAFLMMQGDLLQPSVVSTSSANGHAAPSQSAGTAQSAFGGLVNLDASSLGARQDTQKGPYQPMRGGPQQTGPGYSARPLAPAAGTTIPQNANFGGMSGFGAPQPQMGFQQPQMGFQQPQMGFQQPQMGFQQPQMGFQQPQMGQMGQMGFQQQPQMGFQQQQPQMGFQQMGFPQQQMGFQPQQQSAGFGQPMRPMGMQQQQGARPFF